MNIANSIVELFYNIVPGGLILLLVFPQFINNIKTIYPNDNILVSFIITSLGLLIGFILQGITKFDRKYPQEKCCCLKNLNRIVWDKTISNDEESFKKAKKYLFNNKVINNATKDSKIFYFMHNYLLAKGLDKQTNFYMSRIAFWGNIYYAISLIIIVFPFYKLIEFLSYNLQYQNLPLITLIEVASGAFLIIFYLFVKWLYYEYLQNFNDVILKTFVIITGLKKFPM